LESNLYPKEDIMRKLFTVLALALFSLSSLSACYSAGRATGETAEEVERGADQFERGYDRGRQ
jgi:hypothetical protein